MQASKVDRPILGAAGGPYGGEAAAVEAPVREGVAGDDARFPFGSIRSNKEARPCSRRENSPEKRAGVWSVPGSTVASAGTRTAHRRSGSIPDVRTQPLRVFAPSKGVAPLGIPFQDGDWSSPETASALPDGRFESFGQSFPGGRLVLGRAFPR